MEITARQWEEFDREGFLFLGQVATDKELADMQQRIDDIMLGIARVNTKGQHSCIVKFNN